MLHINRQKPQHLIYPLTFISKRLPILLFLPTHLTYQDQKGKHDIWREESFRKYTNLKERREKSVLIIMFTLIVKHSRTKVVISITLHTKEQYANLTKIKIANS